MQVADKKRQHRFKKRIEEMYPKKKWLDLEEACAFMNMSINVFQDMVSQYGLSVSTLPPIGNSKRSNKKFYKVSELEALIEDNILIKKIS